ncbi:MAG: Fic family protein [Candidatus Falkowbacteria bacterium]
MKDKFAKRLNFSDLTEAQKIQGLIAEIERYRGMWTAGVKLSPQILNVLKRSTVISSTGSSTRIEGVVLTDEQIEQMFKGLKPKKFLTRDQQEVAGYKELLENVFEAFTTIPFSENTVKHFHLELMKYSEKDQGHKGKYKFGDNRVVATDDGGNVVGVIFEPTPPYLAQKEMTELVDWTTYALKEKKIHPLLIIGNFVMEFLAIHPFQDGNGRTSRVLTNYLLLKEGYDFVPYVSHEKYIEDNKDLYYLALNRSQKTLKTDTPNISPWLIFFFDIILRQVKYAIDIADKVSIEPLLSRKQLDVWQFIQEHKEVTPKEIRESLEMPTATVLQVLNKLVDLKKIERLGAGRSTRYKII